MLSVEIGKACYGKKIILENAWFVAKKGNITTIIGESGSGKSTLINALAFNNPFALNYVIEGVNISHFTKKKQREFILDHMGIVYQKPILLEDLKISEHIALIKEISQTDDEQIWIDILELEPYVSLYPNQLSGGQKVRVSLLLAILKNPDVFILDEPTASLDSYTTQVVINTLKSLCLKEKIVIVASHDQALIQQSNLVYEIKNKTLKLLSGDLSSLDVKFSLSKKETFIKAKNIAKILQNTRHHHSLFNKLATFLTIVAIAMAGFAINFDTGQQQAQLTFNSSSRYEGIYVYKDHDNPYASNTIPHAGDDSWQDVITQAEVNALKSIEHVQAVEWRFDTAINSLLLLSEKSDQYHDLERHSISLETIQGQHIVYEMYDKDGFTHSYNVSTFFNDRIYDSFIYEEYQKEGIYLSYYMAKWLCDGEDFTLLKGARLTFNVLIPVYNSEGKLRGYRGNNEIYYPNIISCDVRSLSLPIAGVLNDSDMGIENSYSDVIYINRNIIEDLINEYKVTSPRTSYVVPGEKVNSEKISLELPPNGYIRLVEETPWQPTGYMVFVDDVSYLQKVVTEIGNLGFYVSSPSFYVEDFVETQQISRQLVQIVSTIFVSGMMLIYIAIKWTQRTSQQKINDFLYHLGIYKNDIFKIKNYFHQYQVLRILISSMLVCSTTILVWNRILRWGYTEIGEEMICIILVLTTLIEYIIPMVIERGLRK